MICVVFLLYVIIILLILKNNKNAKEFVIANSSIFMNGRVYDIIKTNFVPFLKTRAKKALSLINNLKKSDINIKILNSKLEQTKNP
jgi:uncharacterized protein YacL